MDAAQDKRLSFRSQERRKTPDFSRLPYCPEGGTDPLLQNPCRRRHSKGRRSRSRSRKGVFRIPLKKEDGNLESQIIEYNCEFPNRVVVRLEYLMQSTKVRLNDRQWMDEFYEKLVEEENRTLKKATRAREKAELTRMKRLIVDGIDKEIPEELSYLHRHPVFRVNQMLQRLQTYDNDLITNRIEEEEEITPVEPYEYDGNKFFIHLHETGTLWVPSEQAIFDKLKLKGKLYRAKLRLLYQKKQKANDEKVMRIINHPSAFITKSKMPPQLAEDLSDLNLPEDASRGDIVDMLQTKYRESLTRIEERIRQSKAREMERDAQLDQKRREQEKIFVDMANYDTLNLMSSVERRNMRRTVEEILEHEREEALKAAGQAAEEEERKKGRMKPFEKVFDKEKVDVPPRLSSKYDGTLFEKLRKAYKVPGNHPFKDYEEYDNELITGYLKSAQDAETMIERGEEIALLYDRQFLKFQDHERRQQRKKKGNGEVE